MIISFPLPVGAKSDVKELEYISALHQTCLPNLRKNATISMDDIQLYLQSRYGLQLNNSDVLDIVNGLGGTSNSSCIDEESDTGCDKEKSDCEQSSNNGNDILDVNKNCKYLDLVELVAALIIPTLIRSAKTLETKSNKMSNSDSQDEKEGLSSKPKYDAEHLIYDYIIGNVLQIIQSLSPSVAANSMTELLLTRESLKEVLVSVGETKAAGNNELIDQMIACASDNTNTLTRGSFLFDELSFARALTSDILQWENAMEDNLSTSFYDVFGCDPVEMNHNESFTDINVNEENKCDIEAVDAKSDLPVHHEYEKFQIQSTCPSIDYVIDSFYSLFFVIALWIFYMFSAGVYVTILNMTSFNVVNCGQSFGCELLNRIWSWASFALILIVAGMIIIVPISIANDPYQVRWKWSIFSGSILIVYSILPFVLYATENDILKSWGFDITTKVYLGFGIFLLIFIPFNLISSCWDSPGSESSSRELGTSCWRLSNNLLTSTAIKCAATTKINTMLQNAYKLHKFSDDEDGETIHNLINHYLIKEDEYFQCGGLFWSWKQLLQQNNLLREHGILLHARLLIGQQGQVLTFILFIWFMIYETEIIASDADDNITQVQSLPNSVARDQLLRYLPPGRIIRTSLYIGTTIGAIIGILLIALYLPSTVNTILKLRCGILPSLHDVHMKKYRYSADTIYYNVSNMIFGLLGAMSLFLCFFGGIIYLFQWNVSQRFMLSVLAWLLALLITLTVKTLIVKLIRRVQYKSFYRKRPRSANLVSLAMESWTLGLAGGVLIGRLTQFLLASAFWIGRIDTKFLDDDVNMMGYRFDSVPTNFRKEILSKFSLMKGTFCLEH